MKDLLVDISGLAEIRGFIGASLVDAANGMIFAAAGDDPRMDAELAGAANSEVVRAKLAVVAQMGLGERIEDILVTLRSQYHLIRPLPGGSSLFLYLALERGTADLADVRARIREIEGSLGV